MVKTTLGELLKQKWEIYGTEAEKNREMIDEWLGAVGRLFQQLRAWIDEADPTHILKVKEGKSEVNEPSLGRYVAPRLDIDGLGKWIGILPKARKTIGMARPQQSNTPERATGRIDITDEIRRYVLYRLPPGNGDQWVIQNPSDDAAESLSRQLFEEALMSYFQ